MPVELLAAQRAEDHDVVEPVEELRLEVRRGRPPCTASRRRSSGTDWSAMSCEPEVRRQDQDRVPEVDRAALAVGEPAVVEHLQQHVEDVRVRLLDLVEQHDGVRTPPHRLGELAAGLVADVAGRRADQPGHRVLLGVLAHVDADHRPLVVEQELRQRLGQLGLADAGRAEEQERAGGPVGVGDAGARPADGVGRRRGRRRAGRRPAWRARPPCAAASGSRPRAAGRRGCRSRPGRPRRCRRGRPPP